MSSAEAEYNEACLAAMASAHIKMLLEDLEMESLDNQKVLIIGRIFQNYKENKTHFKEISLCKRRTRSWTSPINLDTK